MRQLVADGTVAGISSCILVNGEVADLRCEGWADREAGVRLEPGHRFRVFSSSKLVTSCAAMLLVEDGRLKLDAAVGDLLPGLRDLQVLRPGAVDLADVEPARQAISLRHLLTHSAGLGYGLFAPSTPIENACAAHRILENATSLERLVSLLSQLPLAYQPGHGWGYSLATDVVARLIEVVSGMPFPTFVQRRILTPLGMDRSGYCNSAERIPGLAAFYAPADVDGMPVGPVQKLDELPVPESFLSGHAGLAGGSGMYSTLTDTAAFIGSLMRTDGQGQGHGNGKGLLQPDTLQQMMRNQLPAGQRIGLAARESSKYKSMGLGGAISEDIAPEESPYSGGEFQWGGAAGTHWWIAGSGDVAGVLMVHRRRSFWAPFANQLKCLAYLATRAG